MAERRAHDEPGRCAAAAACAFRGSRAGFTKLLDGVERSAGALGESPRRYARRIRSGLWVPQVSLSRVRFGFVVVQHAVRQSTPTRPVTWPKIGKPPARLPNSGKRQGGSARSDGSARLWPIHNGIGTALPRHPRTIHGFFTCVANLAHEESPPCRSRSSHSKGFVMPLVILRQPLGLRARTAVPTHHTNFELLSTSDSNPAPGRIPADPFPSPPRRTRLPTWHNALLRGTRG